MENIGRPYEVRHGRLIITHDGTAKEKSSPIEPIIPRGLDNARKLI